MSIVDTTSSFIFNVSKANVGNAFITYAYNDSFIQYLGRWIDASGKWTGWASPQMVFKTINTNYIIFHTDVVDPNASALSLLTSAIDNQVSPRTQWYLSTAQQIYSGLKDIMIMLPDTKEHTIIISTNGLNADIFNQVSKTTIKSISIGSGGSISSWAQGTNILQCVGDSWMGAENDWPRFMDRTRWVLYPIATGGMTCSAMDTQYNFDYAGQLNTSDPTANTVICSFGVNDYNAGVSQASFETSMNSLFDKIRVKQPSAKIVLIQVPDNVGAGKTYGQYGVNMQNVVNSKTNAQYLSTDSIKNSLTWRDANHLDGNGSNMLAQYVNSNI